MTELILKSKSIAEPNEGDCKAVKKAKFVIRGFQMKATCLECGAQGWVDKLMILCEVCMGKEADKEEARKAKEAGVVLLK